MKITKSADCGNSPKNLLIQDICIACIRRDMKYLQSRFADDEKFSNRISEWSDDPLRRSDIREVHIIHPISHGKSGAVEYIVVYKNKNVKQCCLFIEFDSAAGRKIKRIERYELKKG